MAHIRQDIWHGLRSGDWLTAARARAYSLILLGLCGLALVGWVALSDGLSDRNGKPIGTDFSSFYAAGSLTLEGRAADAYNVAAHKAREQQLFGPDTPYYGWLYPPIFLLVAAPLALLPYPLALAAWQASTLLFYLLIIAAILRGPRQQVCAVAQTWLPAALAFPAVFINLGHGQNGFLTAGLLGGALLTLPQRPILAGILFGLLAYKPQFAVVIPFALFAAGRWRTIASAAVTAIVLVGVTWLVFGPDTWWSFLASTETSRKLLLEQGSVGFEKLQSAFAAIRMWGGGLPTSYFVQGAISLAAVLGVVWTWHGSENEKINAALLIIATLLASPHVLDYDLILLAPAIAYFVASNSTGRFHDYEISLLAAAWIMPLLARTIAGAAAIPLGLMMVLALYGLTLRRAVLDRQETHALMHLASNPPH